MSCIQFPRFYFLSRDQLIETLSYSRDCRNYLEMVKQCFPGVEDLNYSLPTTSPVDGESTTLNSGPKTINDKNLSQLEFDINGMVIFQLNFFFFYKNSYLRSLNQ
jgi:hypothetical protein